MLIVGSTQATDEQSDKYVNSATRTGQTNEKIRQDTILIEFTLRATGMPTLSCYY
jgi:hypothetical protein